MENTRKRKEGVKSVDSLMQREGYVMQLNAALKKKFPQGNYQVCRRQIMCH